MADDIRLVGRVDVLAVERGGVTITDFKTGAEDDSHRDQLRLYALLWHSDMVANPRDLPLTALVASYPNYDVAVDVPDTGEIDQIREEIKARVAAADAAVVADTPAAVVGAQCNYCSVRSLCDAYWEIGAPETSVVLDGAWLDLEGTVLREHGVKSFVIRESVSGYEVLVRTTSSSIALTVGEKVRILGVRRTIDPDSDMLIVVLTKTSELYYLNT